MKLITFSYKKDLVNKFIGAFCGDHIIDFSKSGLPNSMIDFIKIGEKGLSVGNDLINREENVEDLENIIIHAPIKQPSKILAIGLNYKDHIDEVKSSENHHSDGVNLQKKYPNVFNKQNSSVAGPFDHIHKPNISDQLDYEGELGFIIGKQCRNVSYKEAKKCIYGFTIINDYSVRDWQHRGPPHTMTMGKSWDTHCPFGPYIVTSDEVGNPHDLNLKTYVNNEIRQSSNTNLMIYDCYTILEYLSTPFTLMPGDLVATGTPEGSAVKSKKWLKPGDVVKVEIDKLGFIENSIIKEPNITKKFF